MGQTNETKARGTVNPKKKKKKKKKTVPKNRAVASLSLPGGQR